MQKPRAWRLAGQVRGQSVTCQFIKNQTSCQDNIAKTCDDNTPFFQDNFCHFLKIKGFDVKTLFPGVKITRKQAVALGSIVGNGLQCPERPLKIGLHPTCFSPGTPAHLSGYGYKPFHAMRLLCESKGYIRVQAERSYNTDKHPISTIQSTPALINAISSGATIQYQPDYFYLLKGKPDDTGRREYLPILNKNHRRLRQIRNIMQPYHAMIEAHVLSCDVPPYVVDQVQREHRIKGKQGNPPAPPDTRFKFPIITFTDNINTGGRMYRGFWIGCKREYRQFVRINGKRCIEVDFSAMHPQLLYQREGLPPQENIYLYSKTEKPIAGTVTRRDIAKLLMLSMINIDPAPTLPATRRNVINATSNELKESIPYQDIEQILIDLEDRHKPIAKHFYSGAWRYCMTQEADIVRDIIKVAMDHNILVLSVHDAVICQVEKLSEIKAIIRQKTCLPFDTKEYR